MGGFSRREPAERGATATAAGFAATAKASHQASGVARAGETGAVDNSELGKRARVPLSEQREREGHRAGVAGPSAKPVMNTGRPRRGVSGANRPGVSDVEPVQP